MQKLATAVLMVICLLAGCAAKDTSTTSTTSTHAISVATPPTNTTAPNHAPVAMLVAKSVNGTAPLNVTFDVSGSDADGQNLTYTLSFGDGSAAKNGTLPVGNVTHRYTLAGNFSAMLNVSDGLTSTNATALVAVGKVALAPPQVVTGSWTTGGAVSCEQFADEDDLQQSADQTAGIDYVAFDVTPATYGRAYHVDVKATATNGGFEVDFYDATGKNLGYDDNPFPPAPTIDGKVRAGATQAIFFACAPGPGSFTYTTA